MIGKAIVGLLTGTSAQTRIYPLLLPQDSALPAVTYRTIAVDRTHAFGANATVSSARVQVDSWGETYADARTLGNEVIAALSRVSGTVAGVAVQDITLETELEIYEDDTDTRRISQDFIVYTTA